MCIRDSIYIDDEIGNIARSDGQDPSHIEDLKSSFSAGVIVNEELGAVKRQPEGSPKPWVLKYGFGRTLSQIELGVNGWAFNPIDGTDTEIEDVQSYENEPKAPKNNNKEPDIIRIKSIQVKEGRLSNNEDDIYACLLYTSPSPRDRQKSRMPSSA